MKTTKHIAVIGAGISGLTTAYWLMKQGFEVSVFEKSNRAGGSIITEKHGDFLVDLGPNSALETSGQLKDLISDLGLDGQKVYGSETSNNRYIVRAGKLHALPLSPLKFLKTPLFSAKAKMRLLKEPFIKPTNGEDISLADFVRYRLGKEFLDYAINPFVAGVYAGDPEQLSTAAAFPKLYALEQNYGSFIKGAVLGKRERKKRGEIAKDRSKLFSFVNGMQVFTDTLAARLEGRIHLQADVRQIIQKEKLTIEMVSNGKLEQKSFDLVVISAPTDSIANLLQALTASEAEAISKVDYPPVAVVYMGFRQQDVLRPLDGFGFLVPKVENRQILGSLWSSSLFPNRAPQGHVAFTTFVGGSRQPQLAQLDDDALQKIVLDDLQELVGLSGPPVFVRLMRWPRAIPQYTVGYLKIKQMFDDLETRIPGLFFAGNFRRGISVGDSVLCAYETVKKILEIVD